MAAYINKTSKFLSIQSMKYMDTKFPYGSYEILIIVIFEALQTFLFMFTIETVFLNVQKPT